MSDLIITARKVTKIEPHSNADLLELCIIDGWQLVIPKGQYVEGDVVVYVPPDSMVPVDVSDDVGVTKYLGGSGRVKCARLRGEPSFGFCFPFGKTKRCAELTEEEFLNNDLAEHYGITKYEPPPSYFLKSGNPEKDSSLFTKYTNIQNIKNFMQVFTSNDIVIATEKIHGTNSRVGYILEEEEFTFAVGSHNRRLKIDQDTTYHFPFLAYDDDRVKEMLKAIQMELDAKAVLLYGEIFGKGVQDLTYGMIDYAYRAFDLKVDESYLDYFMYKSYCDKFGVDTAPILYQGNFDYDHLKNLVADTKYTTLIDEGDKHILEGIVIRSEIEEIHPKLGRKVLKMISDDYLLRKGSKNQKPTEHH